MKRAFGLFDELGYIVQAEPWPQIAEIAGRNLKGLLRGGDTPTRQPAAQRLVDDLLEGPACAARFRPEVGGNVVVESEGRSHVLMLARRHHDVNAQGKSDIGQSGRL